MPINAQSLTMLNNGKTAQSQQPKNADNPSNYAESGSQNPNYANNLNNTPFKLSNGTVYNWRVSPNPTSDYTVVEYRFSQPTDMTIKVFNEVGQSLIRNDYKAAQSGFVDIDVLNWASGIYTIHLIPKGNKPSVKKVVVQQ